MHQAAESRIDRLDRLARSLVVVGLAATAAAVLDVAYPPARFLPLCTAVALAGRHGGAMIGLLTAEAAFIAAYLLGLVESAAAALIVGAGFVALATMGRLAERVLSHARSRTATAGPGVSHRRHRRRVAASSVASGSGVDSATVTGLPVAPG